jgi:hypothetical protein
MSTHLRMAILGAIASLFVIGAAASAQSPHVMATLTDAKWGPAPPCCRPAQLAVSGDPTRRRRTVRLSSRRTTRPAFAGMRTSR